MKTPNKDVIVILTPKQVEELNRLKISYAVMPVRDIDEEAKTAMQLEIQRYHRAITEARKDGAQLMWDSVIISGVTIDGVDYIKLDDIEKRAKEVMKYIKALDDIYDYGMGRDEMIKQFTAALTQQEKKV
jgi:hypothetical protein